VGTPGGGGLGGEANQAKEWKLEALADLFDDEAVLPGIVFVGSESGMEAVTYKLASRGLDVTVLVSSRLSFPFSIASSLALSTQADPFSFYPLCSTPNSTPKLESLRSTSSELLR